LNYRETLDYLYESLPMFHRIGPAAFKSGLGNTEELCALLGNPQNKFKTIHIAGTNGKGSSSHMLAAILQSAGYKTGLFTSPHLKSFRERIKVNGIDISEKEVTDFVGKYKNDFERIKPSFFEMTCAMAFDHFEEWQVDVAVIETGLGGRLDSTNIIHPEVCLITNISFDHQELLGNTLVEIAGEKAGIIKKNTPVVVSEFQTDVFDVFIDKAKQLDAPLTFASLVYHLDDIESKDGEITFLYNGDNYSCSLTGKYQSYNIAGVLAVVNILRHKNFNISDPALKKGLSEVTRLTGLKGRWQVLSQNPLTICDSGHNEAGIINILEGIDALKFKKLHFVIGMVNDKDVNKILDLLPKNAMYYYCQAKIPRAMEANRLGAHAKARSLIGKVIPDVNEAIREAKRNASPDDLIFIGGSTFVVAEIDKL
jgi:dihydrofolate synthase / folylpolyglutamate synthase